MPLQTACLVARAGILMLKTVVNWGSFIRPHWGCKRGSLSSFWSAAVLAKRFLKESCQSQPATTCVGNQWSPIWTSHGSSCQVLPLSCHGLTYPSLTLVETLFLLLVLTRHLQFGWFSVLFYQLLLQLRRLFHSCTRLHTLHISLLQTWGILVTGRKAQKVICLWSPGDLQGLFLLSLSFQGMEEAALTGTWKKEAALTGKFSQPCALLAAVWVWWGLKVKTRFQRGLSLSFS